MLTVSALAVESILYEQYSEYCCRLRQHVVIFWCMHKRVPCPPAVRYFDFRVSLFSLTSVWSISNCFLQILTASVNFFAVLLIRKQSIEKDVISIDSCSTEVACPVLPCDVILKSVFFFTLQCAEALQNVGRR